MRLGFFLLSAPIGYALLTGYLLLKVRPVPITLLSSGLFGEEERFETQTLAA
jgi:hypothetical protein